MKPKVIDNIDLLDRFSMHHDSFDKDIVLNLNLFDKESNENYTKRINEYRNACGCDTGTVFMIVSIIITIVFCVKHFTYFKSEYFKYLILGLIFVIASSLFGKLFGLLIANYKLKRIISEIKHRTTAPIRKQGFRAS